MDKKPSYEKLNLLDFDLLGMFQLRDVEGIEHLVTPVGDGTFISRGQEFCREITCAQASEMREKLKELLKKYPYGKKAFVIVDHMANLSGKVYYEEVQRAINKKDYSGIGDAKRALTEDVGNIIRIIEDRPIVMSETVLPKSPDMLAKRIIECNNMALLYVFTKCFEVPKGYSILNTGLGGIFIGPFFNCIHGTKWTNLLKSKYVDEVNQNERYDISKRTVNFGLFKKNKKVLLLDDNIGTGATAREIETEFKIKGYDIISGAVQYNWRNFYLVGIGAKEIQRFNPAEIEYITQFNYPGHKLIDHAFKMLTGRMDLSRNEPSRDNSTPYGLLYLMYKKEKGYSREGLSDILTLQTKGVDNCIKSGIELNLHQPEIVESELTGFEDIFDDEFEDEETVQIFTEESMRLMRAIDLANTQMYGQMLGEPLNIGKKKSDGEGPTGGEGSTKTKI